MQMDEDTLAGIEAVQEQILELLQTNPTVMGLVMKEYKDRFKFTADEDIVMRQETTDEIICICQLLVYRRILTAIAA